MLRQPRPLKSISAGRRFLRRRRPDGFMLLLAGIGVLGAALVLAQEVSYGVALHIDPVYYISVARNLLAGDGFSIFGGNGYHDWPPLYPLLLAVVSMGILDPLTVAGPLNAAIFGLTVFIAGIYLRARLESRWLVVWGCLALALAWPLLAVATAAMSGALFVLLATLALIQVERIWRAPDAGAGLAALIWAGAFTALACLTRYIGITLVLAIVPLLALQRGVAIPEKARRIIIYTLIALAPLGLWMLRNQLLVGNPTGKRGFPVAVSVEELLYRTLNIFTEWILRDPPSWYYELPSDYTFLLGGLGVALLTIALGPAVWAHWQGGANGGQRRQLLFGWFAAVYVTAVIGAGVYGATTTIIGSRYLVPAYLPLLLTALLALDAALGNARRYRRRTASRAGRAAAVGASVILIAGLLLWLAWQIPLNVRTIYQANSRWVSPTLGYNYASLADAAALRYLRAEITEGVVFSYHEAATYILSEEGLAEHHRLPCGTGEIRRNMSDVVAAGPAYLLWLYGIPGDACETHPGYHGGLDKLLAVVPLEPVAAFDEGVLLRYRPPSAAADTGAAAVLDSDPKRDLRQHYAAIADGVPVAVSDSGLSLYLDDAAPPRWATYINEQCPPGAMQATIYLRVVPVNSIYLAGTERRHGATAYSFQFARDGIRIGNQCMVSAQLPNYAISSISTGQSDPDAGVVWALEYEPRRPERLRAALAAARQSQPPVIQSDFAVYQNNDRLLYAKAPCVPADTEAPFYLHIVPVSDADLPASGRQHGYDNRDFAFDEVGALVDGRQCLASVALPDYDIAVIRTGQYRPDAGRLWAAEFAPAAR